MNASRATMLAGLAALLAAPAVLTSVAAARTATLGPNDPWRKKLSPQAYVVMREGGTEPPGSSALEDETRTGTYACAACNLALFASATKFDSGTGWPSFYAPLPHAIATSEDRSLGMLRTEVHCRRCAGHLGHVFDDGPPPTGLRYCMNGVALVFRAARS